MGYVRARWIDKGTQEEREECWEANSVGYDLKRTEDGYFTVLWADKLTYLLPTYQIVEIEVRN